MIRECGGQGVCEVVDCDECLFGYFDCDHCQQSFTIESVVQYQWKDYFVMLYCDSCARELHVIS